MSPIGTLLLVCILIVNVLSTKKYVATFGANNFTGEVIVDNGMVSVELDLSSRPDFGINGVDYETCIEGGLKWHIHHWLYTNDLSDKLGSDCGPSKTGGHIDPWNACGPASGNMYCDTSSNDYNYSCIDTSTYSPDYEGDPFSAEVGDWSAKYGAAVLENDTFMGEFSSFWEVIPDDLDDYSVVFHCGSDGAPRAFCAPFVLSDDNLESTIPPQPDDNPSVAAYFNTISADSEIILHPNGNVYINLNANTYYSSIITEDPGPGCSNYEYTIFNAKAGATLNALTSINGDDCLASIDTQYDPTRQCLPWSDADDCDTGKLCGDPEYEYDCDWSGEEDGNRYSCAPGDLSGKFGTLTPTDLLSYVDDGENTLLPPTKSLIGKIIAIHCPYEDQPELEVLSCAMIQEIEEYTPETTEPDSIKAYSLSFIFIYIIMTLFTLL